MALVQYSRPKTNLDQSTDAFDYLEQINKIYEYEKCFVEEYEYEFRNWFKKKIHKYYAVFFEAGSEYQHMRYYAMMDYNATESYLHGYLNGLLAKIKGVN